MNKETVEKFIDKLKDERNEIGKKIRFMDDHKFYKEKQFLEDRYRVIQSITNELDDVLNGSKVEDVRFVFQ